MEDEENQEEIHYFEIPDPPNLKVFSKEGAWEQGYEQGYLDAWRNAFVDFHDKMTEAQVYFAMQDLEIELKYMEDEGMET